MGNRTAPLLLDDYLATAYAEGFCEGEGASTQDQLQAWAYLIRTGLAYKLQGSFGRAARTLIEDGYIEYDGTITEEGYAL